MRSTSLVVSSILKALEAQERHFSSQQMNFHKVNCLQSSIECLGALTYARRRKDNCSMKFLWIVRVDSSAGRSEATPYQQTDRHPTSRDPVLLTAQFPSPLTSGQNNRQKMPHLVFSFSRQVIEITPAFKLTHRLSKDQVFFAASALSFKSASSKFSRCLNSAQRKT